MPASPDDAALQQAARCKAIVDNAVEAIITMDENGIVTHVNPATTAIFGYPPGELIGSSIALLIPAPPGEELEHSIQSYLETGTDTPVISRRELSGRSTDGARIAVELTLVAIRVDGTREFTAILRDLSERKLAEDLIRQRDQQTLRTREHLARLDRLYISAEMSTGIAHELNQPLTTIALYAQACRRLIENGAGDPAVELQALDRIEKSARQAGEIIREFRGLVSRHKAGHEQVDINRLIENCPTLIEHDLLSRNISLKLELAPNLPSVHVIQVQIQQVVLYLLRNASDALASETGTGPKWIVIRSERLSDLWLRVAVRDNGPGISNALAARIFQPFFTTKKNGMGMGLAISQTIIGDHGGELRLNEDYRAGAEFYFTLPIRTA